MSGDIWERVGVGKSEPWVHANGRGDPKAYGRQYG